ncbi:hypothetical protein J4408_03335 [Candidatus Pacearchaeota archaeon]|nr:hypothetical protein [Candidatus Pacearchaeota archaeon]
MLKDSLKEATIKYLESLDIDLSFLYAQHNSEELRNLRDRKIISDEEIEDALEVAILNQARKDYDHVKKTHFRSGIEADHIGYPEILVYGIERNLFSATEKGKFVLDHGMNLETFCKQYRDKEILKHFREKLLSPKVFVDGKYCDPHPACCH